MIDRHDTHRPDPSDCVETRTTHMAFSFPHRSASRSMAIRQALAQAPFGSPAAAVPLTILERPGSYVGRQVTFFRAFDPARAATAGIHLRAFSDLDAHADLMVGSGHVERDGLVVLTGRPEQEDAAAPSREPADRTAHVDDERFVFWDTRLAGTSTLALSQPAAAWLHAQSAADLPAHMMERSA
jgi:hypothetical protein